MKVSINVRNIQVIVEGKSKELEFGSEINSGEFVWLSVLSQYTICWFNVIQSLFLYIGDF